MQHVIKTLGAELKLSGRTVIFTPVKYLVPIKKAASEIESNSETGPTSPEQGLNNGKVSQNSLWWSVRGSNSPPQLCHSCALPDELTPQYFYYTKFMLKWKYESLLFWIFTALALAFALF